MLGVIALYLPPNRALFLDRLGACVQRLRREPDERFAVLFLDLDRFKVVNDSLGHAVGDALLLSVGRRLEGFVRETDTVARFGGDEFAVLLDPVTGHTDALRIARRMRRGFRAPHRLVVDGMEHEVFATMSAGIALGETSYRSAQEIVRDADTAMYRAKLDGPGEVRVFNERMHAEGIETPGQRLALCNLGCDRLQGYLFGRPVSADRLPLNRPPLFSPVSA